MDERAVEEALKAVRHILVDRGDFALVRALLESGKSGPLPSQIHRDPEAASSSMGQRGTSDWLRQSSRRLNGSDNLPTRYCVGRLGRCISLRLCPDF